MGAPQLLSSVSDDARFDETRHINAMEGHLKQEALKIVLRTSASTLVEDISALNWINDQPVTGLSALGHYRLMECAKERGLKVIMSGQGADEILLGYRKYLGFYLQSLMRRGRYLRAAGVLARFAANRTVLNQIELGDAKRYLPLLRKLSAWRSDDSEIKLDGAWLRGWNPVMVGLGAGSLADRQLKDIRELSVPALCHYEDRMSMAVGREIRLPFLDSRLVDLMLRAPDEYKLRKGWTKYCLREAMRPFLPPQIAWRKDKKGFSNPQGEWLKHELQEPVREAFSPDGLLCAKRDHRQRSASAQIRPVLRAGAGWRDYLVSRDLRAFFARIMDAAILRLDRMTRMRIIYLHQYFNTPEMSGSTRSYEVGRRLVAAGHQVDIITSWREATAEAGWFTTEVSGMRVHWLPVKYSNRMNYFARIVAFFKFAVRAAGRAHGVRGDVVLATSTPLTIAIPAVYAARRLGIPMVFEVRDLWPDLPIADRCAEKPFAARRGESVGTVRLYELRGCDQRYRRAWPKESRAPATPKEKIAIVPNASDPGIVPTRCVPWARISQSDGNRRREKSLSAIWERSAVSTESRIWCVSPPPH